VTAFRVQGLTREPVAAGLIGKRLQGLNVARSELRGITSPAATASSKAVVRNRPSSASSRCPCRAAVDSSLMGHALFSMGDERCASFDAKRKRRSGKSPRWR